MIEACQGTGPDMNDQNASEKTGSFPGRLSFFAASMLFFGCFVWKY